MRIAFLLSVLAGFIVLTGCQKWISVEGFSSTEKYRWRVVGDVSIVEYTPDQVTDIEIMTEKTDQIIDGFGGCFNELGCEALQLLDETKREDVMQFLFSGEGCDFNICRMPIGANDFAVDWYSLNDSVDDFGMENFNIERDRTRLVPYIKLAMKHKPDLKVWGSPWCPPVWMKKNGNYACSPSPFNELDPELPRSENGDTDFIMKKNVLEAYAHYFLKYVQAYRAEGIDVYAIHVQNEPHSCQIFPSCLWRGTDLRDFIVDHLGPLFSEEGMETEIWYGTFERPYRDEWAEEIDAVLDDERALKYIKGFGFQWAGKDAVAAVHEKQPNLKLMHTETECGDGNNTWGRAEYIYDLFRHYFDQGANSQMHWNMILAEDAVSTWGWIQNSMITVHGDSRSYSLNPEFYVMKHFSHFIKPGVVKLKLEGDRDNELAFKNRKGDVILVVNNRREEERELKVKVLDWTVTVKMAPHSFNSYVIRR